VIGKRTFDPLISLKLAEIAQVLADRGPVGWAN
jgi:hypothetical protein